MISTTRHLYEAIRPYLSAAVSHIEVLETIDRVLATERNTVPVEPSPTPQNLSAEQAFEQVVGEHTLVKPQPPTARQRAEIRMGARRAD